MKNYQIINDNKPYKKGIYKPNHPEKYIGNNIDKIIFRSSWELHAFKFLDNNPFVLEWASESIPIAYKKPMISQNGKPWFKDAVYYPDLYVKFQDENGKIFKEIIEIKPKKQTKASKSKNPKTKLEENYTHTINQHKWEYAKAFCEKLGISFKIITENSLFK